MSKDSTSTGHQHRIDHFYARADRWRELTSIARRSGPGRGGRETVEAAFRAIELQEEFHAFPGSRLMTALRDRLDPDRFSPQSFAALVQRISSAIVTRDYKHDPSEWETDDAGDVPVDLLPPTLGGNPARRPYFETLIVTPSPMARWPSSSASSGAIFCSR